MALRRIFLGSLLATLFGQANLFAEIIYLDEVNRSARLQLEEQIDDQFGAKREIVFVAAGGDGSTTDALQAADLGRRLALSGKIVAVGADYGLMHFILSGAKEAQGQTMIFDVEGEWGVRESELADLQIVTPFRDRQALVEEFSDEMIVFSGRLGTHDEMIAWMSRLYTDPDFRKRISIMNTELGEFTTRAEVLMSLWPKLFEAKPGTVRILRDCAALMNRLAIDFRDGKKP